MFVEFSDLPPPVQEKWNAKAVKGNPRDWGILKTLVFDKDFPDGSYQSIREAAESAAINLYKLHDRASKRKGKKGEGLERGTYRSPYSYALENLMEKMWATYAELRISGD